MHGIDEVTEDSVDSSLSNLHLTRFAPTAEQSVSTYSLSRATRVSLTIRYVPKVCHSHPPLHLRHRSPPVAFLFVISVSNRALFQVLKNPFKLSA